MPALVGGVINWNLEIEYHVDIVTLVSVWESQG